MSLKKIQNDVDEWMSNLKIGYWNPLEIQCRLSEEVGEFAREVNHRWGAKKKKSTEEKRELADEIADIFFTLICFANSQNIDLEEAWEIMMKKLNTRDKDRHEKKIK